MVIWVNGPFGVGKTTTVAALRERLPGAYAFDPEHIGTLLQMTLGPLGLGDFQLHPCWPELVVEAVVSLHRHERRPMLVPMTIWRDDVHERVLGGIRGRDVDVRHVTLLAPEPELRGRIASCTTESEHARSWRTDHVERCLTALPADRYAHHVDTGGRTVDLVAAAVLALTR